MRNKSKFSLSPQVISMAAASVLLSACFGSSTSSIEQAKLERDYTAEQVMKPASLQPGDRFRLDNPDMTWKVTVAEQGKLIWENDSGGEQTTSMNPLLPALSWSSANGQGKRLLSNIQGSFFPLEIGAKVNFRSTVSTDKPPYAWEFDWSCNVAGETRVNLPVGVFDTFRVECSRQEPEVWTFYYAPKLGYYVMMEQVSRTGGNVRRRILTGYDRQGIVVGSLAPREVDETLPSGSHVASPKDIPSADTDVPPPPMVINDEMKTVEVTPSSTNSDGAMQNSETMGANTSVVDTSPMNLMPVESEAAPKIDSSQAADPVEDIMALAPQGESPASAVQPAAPAPAPQAASAATTVISAPPAGYYVHLASYSKDSSVDPGWSLIQKANGGILSVMFPYRLVVNIPNKGRFVRLLAGPVGSRGEADSICRNLKGNGQYCSVYQQN